MSAEETAIERVEKKLEKIEKKVDSINTALYGIGNPHGGLFGEFKALEVKIDGVESKLEAKIDGVERIFDKMSGLFKWSVGIASVPFCAIAIPIFIEIVLPIIRKWMGFSVIAIAIIWTATTAQAQLYIDVYPSQDNPDSEIVWIFSGSSTAHYGSSIRSSQNYHARDSWKHDDVGESLYLANKPTNQLVSLSPLFSNTNNPTDIESIQKRIPGSDRTQDFDAIVTNAPTVTIGSTSRPIGKIFMNDADVDEIGIRITPPNLVFTNGQTSRWFGAGILNKPHSDFAPSEYLENPLVSYTTHATAIGAPYFAERQRNGVRLRIHHSFIPEPAGYALVFGLFAIGFIFFRRLFLKNSSN